MEDDRRLVDRRLSTFQLGIRYRSLGNHIRNCAGGGNICVGAGAGCASLEIPLLVPVQYAAIRQIVWSVRACCQPVVVTQRMLDVVQGVWQSTVICAILTRDTLAQALSRPVGRPGSNAITHIPEASIFDAEA